MCCQDVTISQNIRWSERTVTVNGGTATKLCERNPRRLVLIISNTSTGGTSLSTLSTVTNTAGIRIDNTANRLEMNFRTHPGLVHADWWGAGSAVQNVQVIEGFITDPCDEIQPYV